MRPSRLLIVIAIAALAISILAVASGGLARETTVVIWVLLAFAILGDFVMSRVGNLALEADAPREAFVGEGQAIALGASPRIGYGDRRIGVRVDWPDGLSGTDEAWLEPAGDGSEASLAFTAHRRGLWQIERAWLFWPSRFGLLEFTPRVDVDLTIRAVPNIRPVQSGVIDVKVRSTLFGVKENFAVGEGSEFHQIRDFTAGMDVRTIDWKRSARNRKLVARELRAERNHHVIVALDNGHLMMEEVAGLPKIDHAVNAALALSWAAVLGGDLIGLYAYDARPSLFLPPAQGRRAFAQLRSRSAELDYRPVESNLTLALTTLNARTPRRSLIVIFSDFVDSTTAELMVENIGVMARRHVIVFVALNDPQVAAVAEASPASLDEAARAVAAGEMLRERRLVFGRLQRLGVRVIDVPPHAVTARLISTYLELKAREVM